MIHKYTQRVLTAASLAALPMLGLTGCDEGLTENPPHILVADNLFRDATGFEAAVNGLYALVREERNGTMFQGSQDNRGYTWHLSTDAVWANDVHNRVWGYTHWGNVMNAEHYQLLANWEWLYGIINAANTIVGRAENGDVRWTEVQKNRAVGEARLIRAWAYRHLTYMFGDVPLTLKESSGVSVRTDWQRSPVAAVRQQMEQDLLFAEQHLPNTHNDAARVTRAVAQHYLAELYLAVNRAADAERKAEAVIQSGDYRLITARYGVRAGQPGVPFMDQFVDGNVNRSQGNTEALWTFQYKLNTPGGGRSNMRTDWVNSYWRLGGVAVSEDYGGRGIGRMTMTKWALDQYEPQDDRGSHHSIRKFYLFNTTSGLPRGRQLGDTVHLKWARESRPSWDWPSTRKWDWADPLNAANAGMGKDQPYLRLAETYLLAAEAEQKQGKLAEAAEHLNVVRRRANASPVAPGAVNLDFILDERARELLTEEHRRYTLLRTRTWLDRTRRFNPLEGPNIAARDTVFPIPQKVIDANLDAVMPQNPGY